MLGGERATVRYIPETEVNPEGSGACVPEGGVLVHDENRVAVSREGIPCERIPSQGNPSLCGCTVAMDAEGRANPCVNQRS